jgi:alpha/beta superfamily hydrolase
MGIVNFSLFSDGIRLAGEMVLPEKSPAPYPVAVICHGIPGGRPANGDPGYRPFARQLAAAGFLSVLFNFRGCGESGGNIDLAGWCNDLSAVLEMVYKRDDADITRVNLVGFSGGAAVSANVAAADKRIFAVALMAAPAEFSYLFKRDEVMELIARAKQIGSIRDQDFPPDPTAWIEGFYSVKAEDAIGAIAPRPVLIVHGTEDEVVPVEHAHRLFAQAGEPRELVPLDGVLHRLRQEPRALQAAVTWLCRINKMLHKEE